MNLEANTNRNDTINKRKLLFKALVAKKDPLTINIVEEAYQLWGRKPISLNSCLTAEPPVSTIPPSS